MARERTYKNETAVKKHVRELLNKHKWFHWPAAAGSFTATGIADRLSLRAGVFLAVEAKFNGNRPTPLQKGFLQSIMAEGGFGFVVDENNILAFQTWLETFDRTTQAVERGQKPLDEDMASLLDLVRVLTELMV